MELERVGKGQPGDQKEPPCPLLCVPCAQSHSRYSEGLAQPCPHTETLSY